jgi:hypothetical protein
MPRQTNAQSFHLGTGQCHGSVHSNKWTAFISCYDNLQANFASNEVAGSGAKRMEAALRTRQRRL